MGILQLRQVYGELQEFRGSYAASNASVAIASVSDANTRLVVGKLTLSSDTAGYLTLQSGATNIGPGIFLGANGGAVLDEPDIKASYGAALNFSDLIAGSHVLYIKYYVQGYSG